MRLARTMVVLGLVGLVGCLPARRDNDPAPDTGAADTSSEDSGDDTSDDAGGEDSGAADTGPAVDTNVPVGCEKDADCTSLVSSPCHVAKCNTDSGLCETSPAPDGAPCGDSTKCLTAQQCSKGACVGTAVDCDDKDPCTTDQCSPEAGCLNIPNEGPCDDADPCTADDKCKEGDCAGTAITCKDDGDSCTKNYCNKEQGGCVTEAAELAAGSTIDCDDGNKCTEGDRCDNGKCISDPKKCKDDGNPCTLAGCQPLSGDCAATPNSGAACDDGDGCTKYDTCSADGSKCSGVPVTCDDDNKCTDDACKDGKCAFTPNTAACDDGDPCTSKDACKDAKCAPGTALNCDDGSLCTDDSCSKAAGGCVHKSNGKDCNDGDVCTDGDKCVLDKNGAAFCGANIKDCDDKNPCTKDSCNSKTGCVASALKNGTGCKTGAGKDGFCVTGACLVPECKNWICEVGEDTKTCVDDCPAGGGACAVTDATCINACQTQRCDTYVKACTADAKCPTVKSCMEACKDSACELKCAQDNPTKSVAAYHELGYCLSTRCYKNGWNGKPCTGTNATASCIDACGMGVCPTERLACFGDAKCKAIVDCQDKCPNNDNTCPPKCITAQPKDAQDLFLTYDDCLAAKCK